MEPKMNRATVSRLILLSACLLTFSLMFCAPAAAQDDDPGGKIISEILVEGNDTVSKQTIMSQIRTFPGRPVSSRLLSEDLKRLYSLGYFKDVQIKQQPDGDQLRIVFIVKEKAILTDVRITGNQKINIDKIRGAISAKAGGFFDEQTVRRDVDAIRRLYEEKGFYSARVTYKYNFDPDLNQAVLDISINEGAKVVVRKIMFEGTEQLKEGQIRKKIQTREYAWWGLVSGLLKEDVLDLDLQRIRAHYDENGFSDAKVDYRTEDIEGAPGNVELVFIVEEGQQYLVGDVVIKGNELFSDEAVTEALELKQGQPFSRKSLRQSVSNIQDLYFEKGYMNARVAFDSFYNDLTGRVDTMYDITENRVTHVNRIKVRGNTKTKDIVIRRELRVYPGEAFNGAALKRSKERLFNLGYFEEVQFDTEDTADEDTKDLVVAVKEAKTGEFSFGGGFSSIDKAIGFVQIRQRNFDIGNWPSFTGAGQDLSLRVQLGSVRSQGEISWTDPWFMGYPFSLGFDFYKREIDRTRSSGLFFDEDRTGGRLRIGKEITDYDSVAFTYGYEEVTISDIPDDASQALKDEEGETELSRAGLTLTRDTRDNRFVPTSGYLLQGSAENVGGFLGGDRNFWRVTGLAAGYLEPVAPENVLELKGRLGVSDSYEDTPIVPVFERFYAGGANTVRGYRERRLGPRDPGNREPIGGETYWVGNVEYTFPLVEGIIKGAAFYDVGNVYEEIDDFGKGGVYQGVGVGVRIKTPIGPVKVDAGYPLDDLEGEDKDIRFYFNMSRGF